MKSHPQSIRVSLTKLHSEIGKSFSRTTLKRYLHQAGYSWRRMRKSLKNKRDEADFQCAREELLSLQSMEDQGLIELYYYDESGFSLTPCVPYGWQKKGETISLPADKKERINVLGFLKRDNTLEAFSCLQSVDTNTVIACMDAFALQRKNPQITAYVIIDNAPVHNSKDFREQEKRWEEENIIIKRLPAYSPELNLVEILWKKMKYEWINIQAFQNLNSLQKELDEICKGVGDKYTINFG